MSDYLNNLISLIENKLMSNTIFATIQDQEFISKIYGRDVYHDKSGTIGAELTSFFKNPVQTLSALGPVIRGDLFLFKNGVACREAVYFDAQKDKILWDRIWQMYHTEGVTIYLRGLQKYFSEVSRCLNYFTSSFPNRIPFANIFITPKESIGLNAHFDPTEFIVYQLSGEKLWDTWHSPPHEQAEEMMPEEMAEYCKGITSSRKSEITCALKPGDAMYMPLYRIHAPRTQAHSSSHITVGLADVTSKRLQN